MLATSGEACNNRVYDMHGQFFTQIKQADCLFNSKRVSFYNIPGILALLKQQANCIRNNECIDT